MTWADLFKYPTTFFGILSAACLGLQGLEGAPSWLNLTLKIVGVVSLAIVGIKAQDTKDLPKDGS